MSNIIRNFTEKNIASITSYVCSCERKVMISGHMIDPIKKQQNPEVHKLKNWCSFVCLSSNKTQSLVNMILHLSQQQWDIDQKSVTRHIL